MADKPESKFNFKRPPGGSSTKSSSGSSRFAKPGAAKPASSGTGRFPKPGSAKPASEETGAKKFIKPGFSFKKPEKKTEEKEAETAGKPERSELSADKKFSGQPKFPTPACQAEKKEKSQEKPPIERKWDFGPKTLKKESPEETTTDKAQTIPEEAARDTEPPPAAASEAVPEAVEKGREKEEHEPAQAEKPKAPEPAEKAVQEVNISELISSQSEKAEECAAPFAPLEEKPPSPFSPLDISERNKLQAQTMAPADISPDLHYREQIEIWAHRFKYDLEKLVDAYAGNLILELDKVFSGVKVPPPPSRPEIDTEEIKKRVTSAEEFIEEELKAPEQKGFMAFMKKAKEEAEKLRQREKELKK